MLFIKQFCIETSGGWIGSSAEATDGEIDIVSGGLGQSTRSATY